jgi:hypothetical protein
MKRVPNCPIWTLTGLENWFRIALELGEVDAVAKRDHVR